MSTVKQAESPTEQSQAVQARQEPQIDADSIAAYLESHPDYFERHPAVLSQLALPHGAGSGAISLIERQVSVLRQRNDSAESQLRELVEVARGNDELADKIHALAILLIAAGSRREIVVLLEQTLRMEFNADRSVMVLFGEEDIDSAAMGQFLRIADRTDEELGSFRSFLDGDSVRCGPVRDAQRGYLFGQDDCEIGSMALIPLGRRSELGFIAVGSRSAEHFNPGVSIDFLSRLGELVAAALER
jgi:uncharacterized protein YigA (DUF484 family)